MCSREENLFTKQSDVLSLYIYNRIYHDCAVGQCSREAKIVHRSIVYAVGQCSRE